MNILLASSEVVPFAKTGGLADVCGALPGEIEKMGHKISVFMPAFRSIYQAVADPEILDVKLEIPLGKKIVSGGLMRSKLPGTNVDIYFVHQPDYFHRHQLYCEQGTDYDDNCERFTFFSRAVLESIRMLDLKTEIIHCNDWQTGLIPALLKCEYNENPLYEHIVSLITIHNLAFQGSFWHWDMLLTGLNWKHFTWQKMEHFGRLNLLKSGIVFADAINTVSPTYAKEIQTAEQGCGLESTLRHRANCLSGILNGIDTNDWNPATDPHLPANFSGPATGESVLSDSALTGKLACKTALQINSQLTQDAGVPLIGIVGRLATQKGWSLILPVMRNWLERVNAQWVVLGTGDPDFHHVLTTLHRQYPHRLSVTLDFSNQLAHQIEAGADLFLMPSEYEPCGLNQMYSMAYGTVPVVRDTGGLADTVVNATVETIDRKTANGFSFREFTQTAMEHALTKAIRMYHEDRETWTQLMSTGMAHDWSWSASAQQYCQLYENTILSARKNILAP
jgi:starch synthase